MSGAAKFVWGLLTLAYTDVMIPEMSLVQNDSSTLTCADLCLKDGACVGIFFNTINGECYISPKQIHDLTTGVAPAVGMINYNMEINFCPSGLGYKLSPDGTVCFKLTKWLTWHDADVECKEDGGRIIKIQSQEKNDKMTGLITVNTWLDGNSFLKWGEWRWSNGELISYFNWRSGRPDGGMLQRCLFVDAGGLWDDHECNKSRKTLCEFPVV